MGRSYSENVIYQATIFPMECSNEEKVYIVISDEKLETEIL